MLKTTPFRLFTLISFEDICWWKFGTGPIFWSSLACINPLFKILIFKGSPPYGPVLKIGGDGYLFPKPAPTYLSTHLAGDSGTLQHPRVSPVWRHCPEVAWVMAMCPQCVQLLESDYWPLCLCHWPVLADVLMLVIKILKIDTHVLMLVFSLLLKNTADNQPKN